MLPIEHWILSLTTIINSWFKYMVYNFANNNGRRIVFQTLWCLLQVNHNENCFSLIESM